jgi:hypothetical protein
MADQELLNLILVERAKGVSDDDIKKHLLKKKWSIEDITGALARSHIQDIKTPQTMATNLPLREARKSHWVWTLLVIVVILVLIALGLNRIGTRSGVTDAQVQEALPGDSVFPQPWISIDRSVTLPVPAQVAWPWIVQLGKDRGGWYAPMWLEDTLHDHSASAPLPQFQNLSVGQIVPDWGGGSLQVLQIVPDQYVVYGSLSHLSAATASTTTPHYNFTWALVLEDNTPYSTTFHLRLRIPRPTSGAAQYIPPSLPGLIDYATDEVMFMGLKQKVQ